MTATEVLRRLLDEHGVEWESDQYGSLTVTRWKDAMGKPIAALDDGVVDFFADYYWQPTPAQAIAATLGATDARPTQAESSETCHPLSCNCSSNCTNGERTETCKLTMDGTDGCFGCSECLENIPPLANYCPNCGRRVEQ